MACNIKRHQPLETNYFWALGDAADGICHGGDASFELRHECASRFGAAGRVTHGENITANIGKIVGIKRNDLRLRIERRESPG